MDELMYDTLKTAVTTDLLSSRDMSVSDIRVNIIEDRKYNIPEWMYDYIRDDDINVLLINQFKYKKPMDKEFIEFIQIINKKGIIKNYKYLATTFVHYGSLCGLYDAIYLFDQNKLCKYIQPFINELNETDTLSIIKSYTTRCINVPLCYIHLYLSVTISKFWKFSSKKKVQDKLVELLSEKITPDELDYIYPVIYNYKPFQMQSSNYNYNEYLSNGGTWCHDFLDAEELYNYIALYCIYDKKRIKQMDFRIKSVLYNETKRSQLFNFFEEDELQLMILESVVKHVDNIEFIYWDITPKQHEMLRNYFEVYDNVVPRNLSKAINLLFESVSVNYTGVDELIRRFVKYGNDISQIIPYMSFVSTQENVAELISVMSENDIIQIGEINPIIHDKSDITFIDMVTRNLNSLSTGNLDKVRKAFSTSYKIYEELYNDERNTLYGKTKDFYGVSAMYPGMLWNDSRLTSVDISEIYKKNNSIISYIKPLLLKDSLVYNHIMLHGYVKLRDIHKDGLEHLLSLSQVFQLLDKNRGYGHLLDFKNMGYINICIMYILHNQEKS